MALKRFRAAPSIGKVAHPMRAPSCLQKNMTAETEKWGNFRSRSCFRILQGWQLPLDPTTIKRIKVFILGASAESIARHIEKHLHILILYRRYISCTPNERMWMPGILKNEARVRTLDITKVSSLPRRFPTPSREASAAQVIHMVRVATHSW